MPSQKYREADNSDSHPIDRIATDLSNRLLAALTQQEVAQLIEALFGVLSPDLQAQALSQLAPDTQQTVEKFLDPPQPHETTQTIKHEAVSLAKQAQVWSALWQDWNQIIWEASEEEGKYLVQEAHWEPPYFDSTTFTEDLESVAEKMRPLLQTAFEYEFTSEYSFAKALLEAEAEVASGMPDWIEITDGLYVGPQLTYCVLQWEWLTTQEQRRDSFQFAQSIRQYQQQFREVELDSSAISNYFDQFPEVEQRCIFTGITADKETSLWKRELANTYSPWHSLYLDLVEKYTPEHYLDNLRETIPQRWLNGLPILASLLAQKNYAEGLCIIEETLQSWLNYFHGDTAWTPETSLLIATAGSYYGDDQGTLTLLQNYQQTAEGLNQTERANALKIQQIAIAEWFNWSAMFKALADIPVSESTRDALFVSWRNHIDRTTKPHSWNGYGYGAPKPVATWWVPWLMDSIADSRKGIPWFQQQITQWIANLPAGKAQLGENYSLLRLLTKDLTEIQNNEKSDYPRFYEIVIRPREFSTANGDSRQNYLKQYAPDNLLDQVMNYWKTNLRHFVPKPESAQKSNYSDHARWMSALQELSSQDYKTLLSHWRVDHQRRSNLWKAMKQLGLS